ncbi:heptosyltransferase-2 [Bryocella elongata]|uniref:Heptosyltransferase-2 n=1 Tax=Bryocella elongata TaxID=863522 RepID=A0A1H5ZAM1_9BACT|nr:glycosyltransferase family 9 protein [Bryocella elongata]SEG33090.1 heptosyltransferase-2 [Bryocella elongata]
MSKEVRPPQIVYGVFKGMGDLLWAVPVITAELDRGYQVHLILFSSPALVEFCTLVDFGLNRSLLVIHTLPRTAREALVFLTMCSGVSPKMVWVSPHAPALAASWKIPLVLWTLKTLFWGSARVVGATTEPMARLFDRALPVDRSLPLKQREWSMYALLRGDAVAADVPLPRFAPEIMQEASEPSRFDLIIHPGAMALNRTWPHNKYPEVIALLPEEWTIGVLGLPQDIEPLRGMLPADRSIVFLTGSLRQALLTLAGARILLVMDSGNVHFAEVLGRPAVAVFGKEDPSTIIPRGLVEPVYEKSVPCQPCGLAVCTQTEPFCMTNLAPATVASRLIRLAGAHAKGMASFSAGRFDVPADLIALLSHDA